MTASETSIITKLEAQKKNPNRVSVFLDGAFAFGIHMDLVMEFGLATGRSLSASEQQQIANADQVYVAKATAFSYLAHRSRTEHEVRKKLATKGFEGDIIEQVIERLHALAYLDDATYARTYTRARFANRGHGPQRIRTELMRRGVARPLIEAALEEHLTEEDILASARRHAEKRWPRLAKEPDARKRRKKLSDFLLRRGFTYDTVRRVLDELAEE